MWISESKIREGSPFRLSETKLLTLDFECSMIEHISGVNRSFFILICSSYPAFPLLRRKKIPWTRVEEETLKVENFLLMICNLWISLSLFNLLNFNWKFLCWNNQMNNRNKEMIHIFLQTYSLFGMTEDLEDGNLIATMK